MGVSDSAMVGVHMDDSPITASFGPIDRLICQLQDLEGSKRYLPVELSVNEIGLLIKHLKEFCNPMKNLSEMEDTSFMDKWWMKEVRELCYDTEDYLEEVIMQYGAGVPRTWTRLLLEDVRIPILLGRMAGVIIFWVHIKLKWRPQLSHFLARAKILKERYPSSLEKERADDIPLNKEVKSDISLKKEGRDDIETLTAQLVEKLAFHDKQTQLKVVPIYGFASSGKTILARTLYAKYKRRFHCWAFVRVSRNPDIRSILTSILSQIKAPTGSPAREVQDLIVSISTHLKLKRYFIVIDDVRRTSVWDIISRAFPGDNSGSRIIIITEIEHVALACSGYKLVSTIFKMDSLNACTDTITSEEKNEALNLIYNNLPLHLKTCLLYLSMYPEGCTIMKDDLVKQWVAEGLIAALKREEREETSEISQNKTKETMETSQYKTDEIAEVPQDKREEISEILQDQGVEIAQVPQDQREENSRVSVNKTEVRQEETKRVAGGYFDELVTRGMIRPVDRNKKSEVLSCTVHHMVLDLIRYKSKEDNFIVVVDNLESTLGHPDIVRRLSVQFGCEKGASLPESIMLSQVRSLAFHGFLECVPSIADYGLVRVLMLHIWADEDKIFDLTGIGELYHLRYLKIECNITVRLPSKIRRLQHLGTLELHTEVVAIPSDIGHLEKLVHVCCPSNDNVARDLEELKNLLDLQLTCSTVENIEEDMECLCSILQKLSSLRCLSLVPASGSYSVNTLPSNPSRMCISCDSRFVVSRVSENLQRLELSRRCCMFSRLPAWIGKLGKLCILKIAVGNLLMEDIDILKGMPSLTALSLHVQTMPAERIVFGKEGFSVLKHFKFMCTVPQLEFEAGAMPNLEKLKLCFNVLIVDKQGSTPFIIEGLLGLEEISAIICSAGVDAESVWQEAISNDIGNSKVQFMVLIYYGDQGREMVTTKRGHGILEELQESMEVAGGREIKEDRDDTDKIQDKENASAVTVAGTNTFNSISENTTNLDKFNETMRSLNPDIVQCFKLCSIFPRGSKLRRDDLVHLWVAQGFVKSSRATEEMEDIAEGYIQELVSCSFLQPISDNDCFTIHEVLHDILDKVAGNCFRIENAMSHRGEGWEGEVPRDIHHLLIQNYDGELITKMILGLEYLRTLIVYVVEKGTPVEEKVIESICKRLPKLRVLAVAFSQEHNPIGQPKKFSFPASVVRLKYLRYLAFRTVYDCNITLPSTLNKLQHIQLLDFGEGDILEFTFAKLVNLRHIFCWHELKLPYVGRLSSLQTLPGFKVSNGCELKQLRGLNKLRGTLWISGLENVKSKEEALQANLAAKERLTELTLEWGYDDDTRRSPEVEADVLEGLCPPVGLQKLHLLQFAGWRYPDWMVGKNSGGPEYLQELLIWECNQPVPASGLAEAFPHLRVLMISSCSWDALPGNMEHLTSLKELVISSCHNIRSLPTLPQSLEVFRVVFGNNEFRKSCETVGHPNWQKIEHIPKKVFQ